MIGIITQARMGSTRLPGKVMLKIAGRTLLDYHVTRLLSPVIVATTNNPEDDVIVDWCERRNIDYFRGSETDVLGRYLECAKKYGLDTIVRVTSDCPLIDGKLLKKEYTDPGVYVSNCLLRTWPRGMDFEIFSIELLEKAARLSKEREHVTTWIRENARKEHIVTTPDASMFRLTVDTMADYELIKEIIEKHNGHLMNASELVALLLARPELQMKDTQ